MHRNNNGQAIVHRSMNPPSLRRACAMEWNPPGKRRREIDDIEDEVLAKEARHYAPREEAYVKNLQDIAKQSLTDDEKKVCLGPCSVLNCFAPAKSLLLPRAPGPDTTVSVDPVTESQAFARAPSATSPAPLRYVACRQYICRTSFQRQTRQLIGV